MSGTIDQRIADLGIRMPEPAAPVASYVPALEHDGLLHISGQLPFEDGDLMQGRLGEDRDIDYGQGAARACAVML
ncbi:MAG: RidA family protein, partial [Sphingomonadaceae bacterium]|nr:RidA family protein [Sphingomonadaceae bacterium]